ncbi:MBOAT family protein [Diaphorobacter ruginosibacter]|uniref:Probable alginate O-acetylase AlgI n=1 Tax=Diaphorobacter ruginosibacter TaxID=1715720 RepID=A0A7G9RPR6_9BURK|nr:MBOAT family protein [Diaphorobacter ruginosibacter]QNN57591.1 MBOAT family protein [Diaphorobacter ruginosibacter]
MLFNSYLFLLLFLPIALMGYYGAARVSLRLAALWLCLASFVFYGWWNPQFVALLAVSILFNYVVGLLVLQAAGAPRRQLLITSAGVIADLAVLVHYKYFAALFNFLGEWGLTHGAMDTLILPLGISFFTFTQIGFLLDCRSGLVKEKGFLSYVLFVTFFPHLIAGPILHHKEMIPQFADPANYRFKAENLSIGGMLFVIGLAKKVLLADGIAPYADAGFAAPSGLDFWGAWATSVSYALQIYFDFSGYSDMALGLAKMFGIRFPLNFNSPYKAASIVDFWARWHITLTRYLTSYLYYPVAMAVSRARERRGMAVGSLAARTPGGFAATIIVPTLFTMGLAGIWHGAGLQFLVFGIWHGLCLSINHGWRIFVVGRKPPSERHSGPAAKALCVLITFVAVLIGQAFFRADGMHSAWQLLAGMMGLHGFGGLESLSHAAGLPFGDAWRLVIGHHLQAVYIVLLLGIAWFTPNAHQILGVHSPAIFKTLPNPNRLLRWRPSPGWLIAALFLLALCLATLHKETRFLYFQF